MSTVTALSAPARAGAGAAFAIEAHDLVKTYPKGVRALDGLSFAVPAGTVFALLGPNGAGKSTTVKILTTLAQADSGTAMVAGLDVRAKAARVRHLIGVVAQLSGADPVATGRENVMLSGRIQGLRGRDLARRTDELLGRFGLADAAGRRVRTYSGGMRRRLDVAMGLINRPQVLFLDEPTAGLDPESRSAMWQEIGRLAAAEGLTILLTTHYLEEADHLASQVAIADRGRVVTAGTPDELKGELHGDAASRPGQRRGPASHPAGLRASGTTMRGAGSRAFGTTSREGGNVLSIAAHTTWMTGRQLRAIARQPAYLVIMLIQPVIWLFLFGSLFRKVVELPGFGTSSYLDYLVPGVVIMSALSASMWSGMTVLEEIDRGIMDRFLVLPLHRSAIINASAALQALTIAVQSVIIVLLGWAGGAHYAGGVAGLVVLIATAVLVAIVFSAFSNTVGMLARQRETIIGINSFLLLPLTFLSTAFMAESLMPHWMRVVANCNPVNWALEAGRSAMSANPDWARVAVQGGGLAALAIAVTALSVLMFRAYQKSV